MQGSTGRGFIPESIHRGRFLVVLLAGGRGTSAAAGRAVITTPNQVATGAQVFAPAAAARSQQAGGTEGDGLVGVAGGPQTTEVITADLAGGVIRRRGLVSVATEATGIATTHLRTTTTATASAVGLLARSLHLGRLLGPSSLQIFKSDTSTFDSKDVSRGTYLLADLLDGLGTLVRVLGDPAVGTQIDNILKDRKSARSESQVNVLNLNLPST